MKLLKLIIAFTLLTSCASAQYTIHDYDYPNGAYLQDTNNELDFFVGSWQGIQNNKKYTFQFVKYLHNLIGDPNTNFYYRDELYVKFKVTDLTTNQILYDDTALLNSNELKILQIGMRNGNGTTFYRYLDIEKCELDVRFDIHKISGNLNQIKYCYFEYVWYNIEGCPYAETISIPMFLPKEDLILTKQ